jgi:hypothetical protein
MKIQTIFVLFNFLFINIIYLSNAIELEFSEEGLQGIDAADKLLNNRMVNFIV